MATNAITDLSYEQLLEMVSEFQWLPEQKRLRCAVDCDRDSGPGCQVYGCLHQLAAGVERQLIHGQVPPHIIHSFLAQLVQRYTLLQRLDADSVVTEIKRLVQTVGVDLIFIGVGNAYTTAFALVARRVVPLEWNKFCDYIGKIDWKVQLTRYGTQSCTSRATDQLDVEAICDEPVVADILVTDQLIYVPPPKGGLALAFENPEFAAYADSVLGDSCDGGEFIEEQTDSADNGQPSESETKYKPSRLRWVQGKFGLRK